MVKIEETKYRFFLVNGTDRRQIAPLGSTTIGWELQEETFFYQKTIGSFTVNDQQGDYSWVKDIESQGDLCKTLFVEIEKKCTNGWELDAVSQWSIQSCSFNDTKCTIDINPESTGLGSCLLDNNTAQYNIIQLLTDKIGQGIDSLAFPSDAQTDNLLNYNNGHMFYYSGGGFDDILIRPRFVDSSGNPATSGTPTLAPTAEELFSAGLVPEEEVPLIQIQRVGVYTSGVLTVEWIIYVAWAYRRSEAKIAGQNPPTPNGYTIINDTVDPVIFQKKPDLADNSITALSVFDACASIGVIPSASDQIYNGARDGDTDIPAGGLCLYTLHKDVQQFGTIKLGTIAQLFIDQCDTEKICISDFFQINPENPSSINYVTGQDTLTNDIRFIQRSLNIFFVTGIPTVGNMSFSDFQQILVNAFQVYWSETVNGDLRLEHYSFYENITVGLDTTLGDKAVYTKNKSSYSYKKELLPFIENVLDDGNHFNYNWDDREIRYVDTDGVKLPCVGNENLERSFGVFNTDFEFFIEYPLEIPRSGWTMVACRTYLGTDEIRYEDGLLNGTLSIKRLIDRYYNNGRSALNAKINGIDVVFETTKRLKTEEGLAFPICCEDSFDPRENIKTPIGIGRVISAELNTKTNKLTTNNEY